MDVERLALANEGTTVSGEVDDLLLADLPDGLVDGLDVGGDGWDVLDGTVVGDDEILHVVVPETKVDEFAKQPGANDLEFSSENAPSVDVAEDGR